MRVLIITHIFWPETADFRNRVLAQELVRRGHEVTVLAPFPNYPLGRIFDGYRMSWRQWEELDGFRVLRLPIYPDHSSSGFRRAMNYGSYTLAATLLGPLFVRKPDVVFVHASPMTLGVPAAFFKLLHGCPILLDVVDLWPQAVAGSGMTSSRLVLAATAAIARFAYRVSDRFIALTDGFSWELRQSGIGADRITVIPPWADVDEFHPAGPDPDFGREFGLDGKVCIIHAGNVGPYQDVGNVLAAADLLRGDDTVRFIFIGSGQLLEQVRGEARARGLENVVFAGRLPMERMSGALAWATALLVNMAADPYLAMTVPSKLAAYLATARPLLAAAAGDVADLVRRHGLGIAVSPGNPEALAGGVRHLMALTAEERNLMGQRCGELFRNDFEKHLLCARYATLLEEMAVSRR